MQDSLFSLVYSLLIKNNIKGFSKDELKLQLESHPSYPSLHAITGVLDHFGIENLALDIPQNDEVFELLPHYFIAQLKSKETQSLVLVGRKENFVKLYYSNKKSKKITRSKFLEYWNGITIAIEETGFTNSKVIDRKSIHSILQLLLIGVIAVIYFLNTRFQIFNYVYLLLSFVGVYISTLLLRHDLGIHSNAIEEICSSTKATSCDAVLNSKAAHIFAGYKLSDVSLIYFSGLGLAGLIIGLLSVKMNTLASVSILALPVILYSIYYQGVVIKKWCPLCLVIVGVLLVQAVLSFFFSDPIIGFTSRGLSIFTVSFLVFIVLYFNIKPLITENQSLNKVKTLYYKFKRNYSLFEAVYSKSLVLNTSITNIQEITFGNPNAMIKLLVITNPVCGFCKTTHHAVEWFLNKYQEDIQVKIRFNIDTSNTNGNAYKIATILLNLYQQDLKLCKKAMHLIYTEGVNIEQWINTYLPYLRNLQHEILSIEDSWCKENHINFTPRVYLNNRVYPKQYNLEDLFYFIEEIKESFPNSYQEDIDKQKVLCTGEL